MKKDTCDGLIDSNGEMKISELRKQLPEKFVDLYDVLCIVMYNKPIALVNLNVKSKLPEFAVNILVYAQSKGIKVLTLDSNRSIFFNPKSKKSVFYAVVFYLNNKMKNKVLSFYDYGTLFGYSESSIKGFYKRVKNNDYEIDRMVSSKKLINLAVKNGYNYDIFETDYKSKIKMISKLFTPLHI